MIGNIFISFSKSNFSQIVIVMYLVLTFHNEEIGNDLTLTFFGSNLAFLSKLSCHPTSLRSLNLCKLLR